MNGRQMFYRNTLERILSDRELRTFLWMLIVEDCKVFSEDVPKSAEIYAISALQSMGKRLLADAKAVDIDLVHQAEKDYIELNNQTLTTGEDDERI